MKDAVKLFDECLTEEVKADERLTSLAVAQVNRKAA